MEIFIKVLQGSYAYLLILQILVVTLLALALIWLIARRTQSLPVSETRPEMAPAPSMLVDEQVAALQKQLTEASAEMEKLKPLAAEAQDLKEKVKYLESKLLEYEILQEEIGTLTALKLENEHLKQELGHFQQQPQMAAPTVAVAVEPPAPVIPEPPHPRLEPEPTMAVAPEAAPPEPNVEATLAQLGQIPGASVVMTPAEPTPEPPAPAAAEDATSGLEGLLKQIDELTAVPPKQS